MLDLNALRARARSTIRSSALLRVVVAVGVGALAGVCVTAMTAITEAAHVLLYGIAFDQRLSAAAHVSPIAAACALVGGGLAMGVANRWRRLRGAAPTVDPVEANALRGGRLSLADGVTVAAQTLLSNGCGASVGLEAGYAQIGAALGSRSGVALQLRREDLRTLVGSGAAGAMAAAFGAPLTGAFYAFELIIGAYSLANAGPVIAAAVAGTLAVQALGGAPYSILAPSIAPLGLVQHVALVGLALISAAVGIGAMRAAAVFERALQASALPDWARPAAGGAVLAGFASITPQALGAGHGALALDIPLRLSAITLGLLVAMKLTACLLSLACGFRGGLFFASLFVGSLLGKLYALGASHVPGLGLDTTACVFTGMATLGVAIVGGPLTMTFLVLESSRDLAIAGPVLAACIATSLTVRATFGYSFATWRLHLRGETITGAHDVGWLRDLQVRGLMNRDPPIIAATATLGAFRGAYPLGSVHVVALADEQGRYAGLVSAAEAHGQGDAAETVASLARLKDVSLHPEQDVKEAMAIFEAAEFEVLAVTDPASQAILGLLGEAYAARRFAAESDRAASGVLGSA